jgi:hypothetical protein
MRYVLLAALILIADSNKIISEHVLDEIDHDIQRSDAFNP